MNNFTACFAPPNFSKTISKTPKRIHTPFFATAIFHCFYSARVALWELGMRHHEITLSCGTNRPEIFSLENLNLRYNVKRKMSFVFPSSSGTI